VIDGQAKSFPEPPSHLILHPRYLPGEMANLTRVWE
jgi:hypothetical protein